MKRFTFRLTLAQALLGLFNAPAGAAATPANQEKLAKHFGEYQRTIQRTAAMTGDTSALELAKRHGLQILNLTWEDTGRNKGSSMGPNISDMTIQVQQKDPDTGSYGLTLMPVIRYPNFEDRSADISAENFFLLVGNEKGRALRRVNLKEFLKNPRRFLARPGSWKGKGKSLLADRDSKVLVSAQACFLPVPKLAVAEFNPVLFNYQSYAGDPAVLSILATREGTSVTVIDNKRDGFSEGQRLFFNQKGERASLTGQRLSDFDGAGGKTAGPTVSAAGQGGLNMALLIQVPLKQKKPRAYGGFGGMAFAPAMLAGESMEPKAGGDVEAAVVGHGKVEGPFTEIDDLEIERDERFPVRVTVQFYKATSNGVVSEKDMGEIAGQINKVYQQSDYVGSLVIGKDTGRVTEYDGSMDEPAAWWDTFLSEHEGFFRDHLARIKRRY